MNFNIDYQFDTEKSCTVHVKSWVKPLKEKNKKDILHIKKTLKTFFYDNSLTDYFIHDEINIENINTNKFSCINLFISIMGTKKDVIKKIISDGLNQLNSKDGLIFKKKRV